MENILLYNQIMRSPFKMCTQRSYANINCNRILNNLLRTTMLIFFGLANLNNGLTSHNKNGELQRNINQNGIGPSSALGGGAPSPAALTSISGSAASLPATASFGGNPSESNSLNAGISTSLSSVTSFATGSDIPYPPSSISASTTLYHHQTSGSSITSFDSMNVIDERIQSHQSNQHHLQQQLQHSHNSRQLARDASIITHPIHKPVSVSGVSSIMDTALNQNHLEPSTSNENGETDDIYAAPMYFGTENSTVVTTQIGATAHIPCTIHHIGDGVVSWIRKKDYHLLTVGLTTYSSDERFSATHMKHSEDWTLQIKFVQLRDAGVYECQVSTHPPTSIFLHLNVVEARAEITGPPIRYLTPGSTLRLQCHVVQNTEASEFIFWYHDNRMINYDIDRGINVSTEPDFQSSELIIQRTRREHSGNFTCVASNTQPASVLVHIFKGDNPAAMYHGHVGSSTKSYQTHLHSLMVLLVLGYRILHTYVHIKIV